MQHRRVLQILRTYHNIITGNFHYPNVSSSVKKAVTPRYPYMLRSVGETNKGFLRVNLATWNRLAKQIPEKLNRSMFASRLNSFPLYFLIPPAWSVKQVISYRIILSFTNSSSSLCCSAELRFSKTLLIFVIYYRNDSNLKKVSKCLFPKIKNNFSIKISFIWLLHV